LFEIYIIDVVVLGIKLLFLVTFTAFEEVFDSFVVRPKDGAYHEVSAKNFEEVTK